MYLSRSKHPKGHESDALILASAQARNEEMGLTGFLFRTEHSFLQILEGEEDKLDVVMNLIRGDARHEITSEWPKQPAAERSFGSWAMGSGPIPRAEIEAMQDPKAGDDVVWSAMLGKLRELARTAA